MPRGLIVRVGASVSFNCSVVSSPEFSHIRWRHGNNIVDTRNSGVKYTVVLDTRLNTTPGMEGMETLSTLTIHDVDGYDSNTVECFVNSVAVQAPLSAEVILSVLGKYTYY